MDDEMEYNRLQCAYWEIVAEDADDGLAREQALGRRRYYLYLLGMIAIETTSDKESDQQ